MPPPIRPQIKQPAVVTPPAGKVSFQSIGERKGQRVLLYGTGGVGKTTLACLAPGPVAFIDVDESLPILQGQLESLAIPIPQIVSVSSFAECRAALQSGGWEKIQTIVIDTATKLEEMAVADTLKRVKVGNAVAANIEDYGYGKGFGFVFDTFLTILGDLDKHVRAGRNVILTAHDCVANVPNPNGEDFIRYEPRLQSPNSGKASIRLRLKEWCDHVLFVSYDIAAGKDRKATGSGTRTLYTAERPAFMAKSRTTGEQFDIEHGVSVWDEILK